MKAEHFPAKYFDEIAKLSASQNYFSPVWPEIISETGNFDKMLDLGCGNGIFAADAQRQTGCKLYGVDGSDYALSQAAGVGFEVLESISDFNVDALPFASAEFDFCLCKDLLEHLVRPDHILGEAHRILRQGGFILVHVPNHFSLHGRINFLFSNDIDTYHYFPGAKRWDFPHIRFFTHADLSELLRLTGFQIVKDLSYHFSSVPLSQRLVPFQAVRTKLARRFPSQFAEGFTLLAKKN